MLRGLSPELLNTLTTKNSTQNLHHNGVLPVSFVNNVKLGSIFKVLSHNYDSRGTIFASTIEGIQFPFYATQWHPER
jgi:gamma-glutamyl hydrolase